MSQGFALYAKFGLVEGRTGITGSTLHPSASRPGYLFQYCPVIILFFRVLAAALLA